MIKTSVLSLALGALLLPQAAAPPTDAPVTFEATAINQSIAPIATVMLFAEIVER